MEEKKIMVGDTNEYSIIVDENCTAAALGSGALPVFGTPYLVSMMENAALTYLQERVPEGKGSVGTHVEVEHTASTPIGMKVTVKVVVTHISENGKMIDYEMEAWDEVGPIGTGKHQRAIITNDRFMEKTQAKLSR